MSNEPKMRSYLVLWEPDSFGVTVDQIKVIGAFGADSIGTARRAISGHMRQDYLERTKDLGPGNFHVIEQSNKPDLCTFESGKCWSRHWTPAEETIEARKV